MTFVREGRMLARMGEIPYRDPFAPGRRTTHQALGAANTAQAVAAGTAAVGAGTAAVTAIASGAALGSVVPVVGTAIGAIVGLGVALLSGRGTVDELKSVWDVVPFSLIRLTGGSGHWTDPLTGVVLTDAGSDVRKSAVVASAINAFNDTNNFWYDNTTHQHLTPADAWQRWQQRFGNASFATAYAAAPSAFTIFDPTNSTGDPSIHAPGAVVPAVAAPSAGAPAVGAGVAPQTASIIGGVSNTTLAVVAAGIVLAIVVRRRRGSV